MKHLSKIVYGLLLLASNVTPSVQHILPRSEPDCKCTPDQDCWPSSHEWTALNQTVSGTLIATKPVAASCYPGSSQNLNTCADVVSQWSNASFQADQPLGLDYPINVSCVPVNYKAGETPASCSLGTNPMYAINATSPEHVESALAFASKYNIRVVVKTTGHDLLGRSDGPESLLVWLRYMRTGIEFNQSNDLSSGCSASNWTGSTFQIGGGYTWLDVYAEAKAHDVVVVGGGTPSVSCIGGWMQGGGHGPASRQFGLGADQVLEAEVVLANGTSIVANECQHSDMFFAIRGGGPGTYGVVTSTTIKAWPMVNGIVVQHLAIAPLTMPNDTPAVLDAVSILFSELPDLNDAGYAGYGSWSIETATPLFANFTAGYVHGIYMFNRTLDEAQSAFTATRDRLLPYNETKLFVSETYVTYPDYWTFYDTESGVEIPVGSPAGAGGSRLFDRASVQSNNTKLRDTVAVLAGEPGQFAFNSVELVSGGQVFTDGGDDGGTDSAVLPAWRTSYFNNIISRGWPAGANQSVRTAVQQDVTNVKVKAMVELAPNTGAYMNEGDRLDPDFKENFYGDHYEHLRAVKSMYDPGDLFYCPTCVGSDEWEVMDDGSLCRAS